MNTLSRLFLLVALSVVGSAVAQAEDTRWRLDVYFSEQRAEAKPVKAFADDVNQKSGGRLRIDVYYGESLGNKAPDYLRILKSGAVEMAALYAGYFSRDAPDVAATLPMGIVRNRDQAFGTLPTVREIYAKAYAEWGAVPVAWIASQPYDTAVFCKEPVNTLEALKRKKVRVWSRDQVDAFRAVGVPAQIINQSELYLALQTGVVDCAVYPFATATTISLHEVAGYAASLHTFSVIPIALAVSQRAWAALPPDLQAVVKGAGERAEALSLTQSKDVAAEEEAKKALVATGKVKILEPFPEADRITYYEAVNKVWGERAAAIGRNAPAYRDQLISALRKTQ